MVEAILELIPARLDTFYVQRVHTSPYLKGIWGLGWAVRVGWEGGGRGGGGWD